MSVLRRKNSVTLALFGPFTVTLDDGLSLMPKGTKARALLALLATTQSASRRRVWLQDILWSDRGPQQRAASLRQALAELRKCFADLPDLLHADRHTISLNPEMLLLDRSAQADGQIFLEDLNVRDPAFTAWLGLQRMHNMQPQTPEPVVPQPDARPITGLRHIALICKSDYDENAILLEHMIHDGLALAIREAAGHHVRSSVGLDMNAGGLVCFIKAVVPASGNAMVRVTVEDLPSGQLIFANSIPLSKEAALTPDAPEVLRLIMRVTETIRHLETSPIPVISTASLVSEAITQMFSFEPSRVAKAVTLLEDANARDPSGIVHAWLAQAYNIQAIERHVPIDAAFLERVEESCRVALATAPLNSDVLAAVANARVNLNLDYAAGLELSHRAIETNPANPLAWWAYSNASLCIGRTEQALATALKSQYLAQGTRFEFWADFQLSIVAAVQGKTAQAMQLSERSVALTPAFRPPLRYLIALYALAGDVDETRRVTHKLINEESDFTINRMVADETYPIGIMRRYGKTLTRSLRDVAREI